MTTIPTTIQERVPLPAPGGMPATMSKTLTPADVLAMLRRRMLTIILLSILFGAAAVGLFFLAYFKFPKYSSDALVQCTSDMPPQEMSPQQPKLQEDAFQRFIQSQALFMKSFPILSVVLQDPEVRATKWAEDIEPGERYTELEDSLGCSAIRDTNYIRVAMATRSPSDPHVIVNKVIETYVNEVQDSYTSPYRDELKEYQRELAQVKDQVQQKQEQIRQFVSRIPPGNLPEERRAGGGAIVQQLVEDQKTVSDLEIHVAEMKSLLDVYVDPAGPAITPADRLAVEQDPRVANLNSQILALEQEMNVLLEQFGRNHREYLEMDNRRAEAAKQVEIARANRLREIIEQKRQEIETAFLNAQSALMVAKERLQETMAQQADLESKLAEYGRLLDERDMLIDIQKRIEEYNREIERIVRERSAVRVEVAVRASPPLTRSFPQFIMLPALVFAAFASAVGLALGLELIDNTVKTPQDIVRHLNLSILGSIPDVDDEEVHIENVESAVRDAPQSMVTEAFRSVRSNLQFSAPPERLRSILITSPKPEDGRTTVAANLAASLAVAGRRVLLVDTNFRRPAVQKIYKQIGARGMTNILVGEAKFDECVHKTDLDNLDVVGSGPIPPNPAELLGSELFRKFLTEVTARYDHVVFDSPPVLLASDATVLAMAVDGTILVCRAKDNTRGVALRAAALLSRAGAHLFGGVLNVAQARRGGYFREQQRTFYEYQEDISDRVSRALPDRKSKKAELDQDQDEDQDA